MKKIIKKVACLLFIFVFVNMFMIGCIDAKYCGEWGINSISILFNDNSNFEYDINKLSQLTNSTIDDNSTNEDRANYYAYMFYKENKDVRFIIENDKFIVKVRVENKYKYKIENDNLIVYDNNNEEIYRYKILDENNFIQFYNNIDIDTNITLTFYLTKNV